MQSDRVEYEYRIELLTSELERSSQALQQKSIECEEYRLKAVGLEHKIQELESQYGMLDKQYMDLSENLRIKVIENEDIKSKFTRVTQITLRDYEDKIDKLVVEIEKLSQIVMLKSQDVDNARSQIILKIEELQEERQKSFHLENFIKQIKNEKLEALHFLNERAKELEQWKERFREADVYRVRSSQLEQDIEQIRLNYTKMFEQHLEEMKKLKTQIETQRQINENNLIIAEEKYTSMLLAEKASLEKELKEKVATSIIQMENQVSSLNNLLEAKQNEIEKLRLQRYNLETEKTNSLLIDKNVQLQEQHQKILLIERQLTEKSRALEQLQLQIQSGQLIPSTSQTLLERSYKVLQEDLHKQNLEMSRLQTRALELQDEVQRKATMKSAYEGQINTLLIEIANLKKELIESNRKSSNQAPDQALQRRVQQLEREKQSQKQQFDSQLREQDLRIQFLVSLLPQQAHGRSSFQLHEFQSVSGTHMATNAMGPGPNFQSGNPLYPTNAQLLQAIIEESSSRVGQSNIFYHEDDSQELR